MDFKKYNKLVNITKTRSRLKSIEHKLVLTRRERDGGDAIYCRGRGRYT